MALPPNNPDVCKVAMVFARDTRQFVNTFHVRRSGGWTVPAMTTIGNAFVDWWNTNYKLYASSTVALTTVQVRLYDPSNPLAVDINLGTPSAGTASGLVAAAQSCLSASWRSGLAGRKYRGRFYTVGLTTTQQDTLDKATSAYVTGIGTSASTLLANILATGASLAIFHRVSNTFTLITSTVIENLIDAQRRRLAGRGR